MKNTHYTSVHLPSKAHNAFISTSQELNGELPPKNLRFVQVIAALLCNIPKEDQQQAIRDYANNINPA